jgi:hypothetical protein
VRKLDPERTNVIPSTRLESFLRRDRTLSSPQAQHFIQQVDRSRGFISIAEFSKHFCEGGPFFQHEQYVTPSKQLVLQRMATLQSLRLQKDMP